MYLARKFQNLKVKSRVYGKPKIFGVGLNKTGTTSLKEAMKELGYIQGHQPSAEKFLGEWSRREFKNLISYCHSAEFFQDVPFSLPYTYIVLDHVFPKSKFILTVRDNSEQWYNSITKFHSKIWSTKNQIPSEKELKNATYVYKGWAWDFIKQVFNTPNNDLYNEKSLIEFYKNYNNNVKNYFQYRSNDLLVLNVSKPNSYERLCDFLGKESQGSKFPWKNKT